MTSPPARQNRPRPAAPTVVLVVAAALLIRTPAWSCAVSEDAENDRWSDMERYVGSLATSEPQAKRDLVESASKRLRPLFEGHPDRDQEDVARVVDSLRRLLRTEKDDWITTRLLDELDSRDEEALDPLYLDALKSPSPNLAWSGIRWFAEQESAESLPELQKAWEREERSWVRADLIAALARQGSREHLDDFLELARGKDSVLSLAAIEALATLGDERAIAALARIVQQGPVEAGIASLHALTSWPNDRGAFEAVLRASRSEEAPIQRSATQSLASFYLHEAEDRLIDLALSSDVDRYVRAVAVEGMGEVDTARAIGALVEILREPVPEEDPWLHSNVLSELREIDDPSILEALQDFVPKGAAFPSTEFSSLQDYLGRNRDTHGKVETIRLACSLTSVITDPDDPDMIAAVPPPWLGSIRCWRYPGIAGDPEDYPRIPTGTPVRIEDHFELRGESWVAVSGRDLDECWTPMDFIAHPRVNPALAGEEDSMLIRREFDVPASEVESDIARGLMDAGLLEVIEPGDDVIGVAITVDPADFDMVLLLVKSCGLDETVLDEQIDEIVQKLAPLYPEHPALDRFRRGTADEPPETDTEIDLQMKEASDQ